MTITVSISQTPAMQGNNATTVWPYGFNIPASNNVVVSVTDNNGNVAVLNSNQYSITGIGNSAGGNVTYPLVGSPLAPGWYITIARSLPPFQLVSLANQGNMWPSVVEQALDYLTMVIQGLITQINLSSPIVIPRWVTAGTPAGALNGANKTYTLPQVPVGSVNIFINGLYAIPGVDYTIAAATITLLGTALGAAESVSFGEYRY